MDSVQQECEYYCVLPKETRCLAVDNCVGPGIGCVYYRRKQCNCVDHFEAPYGRFYVNFRDGSLKSVLGFSCNYCPNCGKELNGK